MTSDFHSVTSGEVLARVETEADYLRRRMRQIAHIIENPVPGDREKAVWMVPKILEIAKEAISRPRSNGEVIDNLERELGDLRGRVIESGAWKERALQAEYAAKLSADASDEWKDRAIWAETELRARAGGGMGARVVWARRHLSRLMRAYRRATR
jgi:hypothetical protein